jgi:hypothetical protein
VSPAADDGMSIYRIVHEGLGTKPRGAPLVQHIEVVARIEAAREQGLVASFRL